MVISFDDMPSVPYLLCFNEIIWLYHLMTCHPYLTFCVLIKWTGHTLQCHAIRTLFFVLMKWLVDIICWHTIPTLISVFLWRYRVVSFDDMPSIPYFFLCFTFCVLMRWRVILFDAIRTLFFVFWWDVMVMFFHTTSSVFL